MCGNILGLSIVESANESKKFPFDNFGDDIKSVGCGWEVWSDMNVFWDERVIWWVWSSIGSQKLALIEGEHLITTITCINDYMYI